MKTAAAEERLAFLITSNVTSNGKLALQWFSSHVAKAFEGPKEIVGPLSDSPVVAYARESEVDDVIGNLRTAAKGIRIRIVHLHLARSKPPKAKVDEVHLIDCPNHVETVTERIALFRKLEAAYKTGRTGSAPKPSAIHVPS